MNKNLNGKNDVSPVEAGVAQISIEGPEGAPGNHNTSVLAAREQRSIKPQVTGANPVSSLDGCGGINPLPECVCDPFAMRPCQCYRAGEDAALRRTEVQERHPNDGSNPVFVCPCGMRVEVTETWRRLKNNAEWIERFCSIACAERYASPHRPGLSPLAKEREAAFQRIVAELRRHSDRCAVHAVDGRDCTCDALHRNDAQLPMCWCCNGSGKVAFGGGPCEICDGAKVTDVPVPPERRSLDAQPVTEWGCKGRELLAKARAALSDIADFEHETTGDDREDRESMIELAKDAFGETAMRDLCRPEAETDLDLQLMASAWVEKWLERFRSGKLSGIEMDLTKVLVRARERAHRNLEARPEPDQWPGCTNREVCPKRGYCLCLTCEDCDQSHPAIHCAAKDAKRTTCDECGQRLHHYPTKPAEICPNIRCPRCDDDLHCKQCAARDANDALCTTQTMRGIK